MFTIIARIIASAVFSRSIIIVSIIITLLSLLSLPSLPLGALLTGITRKFRRSGAAASTQASRA
jgi:hypothetical protein